MEKIIGKRIKRLREERGIKQAEMAEAIGAKPDAYRARENGMVYFPVPALIKIAEILGVSLDYLLAGKTGPAELTPEEALLVQWWRGMNDAEKKTILQIIDAKRWAMLQKD
jgi:transcriptional regulator with XRE-family HTH domain